jgi:hypothetical protein
MHWAADAKGTTTLTGFVGYRGTAARRADRVHRIVSLEALKPVTKVNIVLSRAAGDSGVFIRCAFSVRY